MNLLTHLKPSLYKIIINSDVKKLNTTIRIAMEISTTLYHLNFLVPYYLHILAFFTSYNVHNCRHSNTHHRNIWNCTYISPLK